MNTMTGARLTVDRILREHDGLAAARSNWENHWDQIERRVLPRQGGFKRIHAPGDRRTQDITSSTAPLALDKFAAAMEGLVAPRAHRWHGLASPVPALNALPEVKAYFEAVTDILFEMRYAAHSGFPTQFHEAMMSLGAFGTAAVWTEEDIGRGIVYQALDLSEIYLSQNKHGRIDKVSRKFSYSARAAAQRWDAALLPETIRKALDKNPEQMFDFLHFIEPNPDVDDSRADAAGMAFASSYVAFEAKTLLSQGGFHTFPLPVARYVTAPRETYGRSVAMMVLPDIKMANEIARTLIRASHRALDPPLLAQEDGALTRIQTRPGAINYGGLNNRGELMLRPLETGGSIPVGIEMMERTEKVINDAFLVTLFQVLTDAGSDRMTATEVLARVQEKGVLLAPAGGRIETELLGPLIERELDILSRANMLPPMPEALMRSGAQFKVVYDNLLSRAAKAEQAVGFLRTIESLAPLAATDPTVYDIFDPEAAANGIADSNGVPQSWRRTPEQVAALKAQRTQASEAAAVAQAAPLVTQAGLNVAKADALATNA